MIKQTICLAALFLLLAFQGGAQEKQLPPLPNDPATRVGKLENGLTYYIRHNKNPHNRADFYLATHVGAVQELPDQDGLAHFLEHMCFNGTKNFPGSGITDWLQSIGASNGENVNAFTGTDRTVYLLTDIPLIRKTVVDSCILIMHDYSHFVTNDPAEIDAERGVILSEMKERDNATNRLNDAADQYIYNGNKYARTTIIGGEEQIRTFKPESLVSFYQTWYHPGNQALIVIGDIDEDYVEECIKRTFADIPAEPDPRQKEVFPAPDNEEPLIGILSDPEYPVTTISAFWRHKPGTPEENSTAVGLVKNILRTLVGITMNDRFHDLAATENAPFVSAGFGYLSKSETVDVARVSATCQENTSLQGLAASLLEVEKICRYGINEGEIERAKKMILAEYETAAKRASTRANGEFVNELLLNFFDSDAYMEPGLTYQTVQSILQRMPTETVNQAARELFSRENMIIIYEAPEKEGIVHPTEEQIRAVIDAVRNTEVEENASKEVPTEFLDASKLKGSRAGRARDGRYGSLTFTLKNGLRVWLLPTERDKDKIIFNLTKDGGRSLVHDEDLYSINNDSWVFYRNNSGISGFSASDLRKMTAGMQMGVTPYIDDYMHGIAGESTVKDFETALQIAYLYYMEPRFDEAEYNLGNNQIKAILPNLIDQPNYKINENYIRQLYDSPRRFYLNQEVLAKSNLATLERVYRELFNDAAGARLIVVGDFDPDWATRLICKYLGSIPKGKKASIAAYRGDGVTSADRLFDFTTPMASPKVTVIQHYNKIAPYSVAAEAAYRGLSYILRMVYNETLREGEGGTYGANVVHDVSPKPDERHFVEVVFETNVDDADKLRELARNGLRALAENGPTADQFEKAHMYLKKGIPEARQDNQHWCNVLLWNDRYHVDFENDYERAVYALTPQKIQAAAQEMLNGNLIEVVMRPE